MRCRRTISAFCSGVKCLRVLDIETSGQVKLTQPASLSSSRRGKTPLEGLAVALASRIRAKAAAIDHAVRAPGIGELADDRPDVAMRIRSLVGNGGELHDRVVEPRPAEHDGVLGRRSLKRPPHVVDDDLRLAKLANQ